MCSLSVLTVGLVSFCCTRSDGPEWVQHQTPNSDLQHLWEMLNYFSTSTVVVVRFIYKTVNVIIYSIYNFPKVCVYACATHVIGRHRRARPVCNVHEPVHSPCPWPQARLWLVSITGKLENFHIIQSILFDQLSNWQLLLPIVEMNVVLKASSEKRKRRQVFPTPESPINNSLNNKSYVFFAIVTTANPMPANKFHQFHPDNLTITTFIYHTK